MKIKNCIQLFLSLFLVSFYSYGSSAGSTSRLSKSQKKVKRRLEKELAELMAREVPMIRKTQQSGKKRKKKEIISSLENLGFQAFPLRDIFHWRVVMVGAKSTPYEGVQFYLGMDFSQGYPFKAPKVFFLNRCYHPNVMLTTGEICVDLLKEAWSPAMNVSGLLNSLRSLLSDPDPSSALNLEAATIWSESMEKTNKALSLGNKIKKIKKGN